MSYKMLIVDDEKDAREFLGRLLTRKGYAVKDAASGEEALEIIKKEDFDVVLLDVVLPGMSGVEVLQKIKELKPETKIILITGIGYDEKLIDQCMQFGCSGYVGKNIPASQIISSINLFVENKAE